MDPIGDTWSAYTTRAFSAKHLWSLNAPGLAAEMKRPSKILAIANDSMPASRQVYTLRPPTKPLEND
jgi:hypothetical protein